MDEATVTTCYRHPDRATGLSCSTCGRPICVECSQDSAVGQKCPECAKPTGRHQVINARQQFNRPTPVTQAILYLNIGIFLVAYLTGRTELTIRFGQINQLVLDGEWYRMITAAFLHADIMHIGFNMYALYLFGPQIERQMGAMPFAAMYLSAALAGSAAYLVSGPAGLRLVPPGPSLDCSERGSERPIASVTPRPVEPSSDAWPSCSPSTSLSRCSWPASPGKLTSVASSPAC